MRETLLSLAADTALLSTVAVAFVGGALLWFVLARNFNERFAHYRERFTDEASANAADMFLSLDANRLFRLNLVILVVAPLLVWGLFRDLPTTIAVFGLILFVPTLWYRALRNKRLKTIERQLPDALALVAGSLRAGASLTIALDTLVREQPPPLSQEFDLMLKEQRLGVDLDVSLANMEKRIPLQDFAMLATALRINREVGGNLADTIQSLGETLRRKGTMEGKIRSLTAQGKMQGYVMAALPLLLAVLLRILEPEAMEKLWTTPIGWLVLGVIAFMQTMGFLMIRKITSIDV